MNNKRLRLFTCIFGEIFNNCFDNFTVPSIQPDIDKLRSDGYVVTHEIYRDWGSFVREEIRACLGENCRGIIIDAGGIYATDTIYNVVKISENKPHCVAVPHLRIGEKHLDGVKLPASSRDLVQYFADSDWYNCMLDSTVKNQSHVGITLRQLSQSDDRSLISFVHNSPSILIATFNNEDKSYFDGRTMRDWDRDWLNMLFNRERLKVIGSSDIAFWLEYTPNPGQAYNVGTAQHNFNDKLTFDKPDMHNKVFNAFYCGLHGRS